MIRKATKEDLEFIHSVLGDKDIWSATRDDGLPKVYPKQYAEGLILNPNIHFLIDDKYAVFVIHPESTSHSCQFHGYVLAQGRGEYSREVGHEAIEWVFKNTSMLKLIVWVPEMHKSVYRHAVDMGFKVEGLSTKSILIDNVLYDRWLLGLNKESRR